MHIRRLAAAVIALAGLLSATPVLASCVQSSAADLIARADAIVYADVADDLQRPGAYSREVTLRVRAVLKGSVASVVRVRIGPELPSAGPFSFGATSVDWRPTPGDHVVYLRARSGYETDECAGSHPGGPNADELRALGPGTPPTPATLTDEFAALGVWPNVVAAVTAVGAGALLLARLRRRGGRKA